MKSDADIIVMVLGSLVVGFLIYGFGAYSTRNQFDADLYQEMLRKQQARDTYTKMVAAQQQYLEATGVKLD